MFLSVQNIWSTYSSLNIQDITHRFAIDRTMNEWNISFVCVCVDVTTHQGCDDGSKWCLFECNIWDVTVQDYWLNITCEQTKC
jgi:hypothetical protein